MEQAGGCRPGHAGGLDGPQGHANDKTVCAHRAAAPCGRDSTVGEKLREIWYNFGTVK